MSNERLEPWQKAWRDGIAQALPTAGLEALRLAILSEEPSLVRRVTAWSGSDGDDIVMDWMTRKPSDECRGACPIGYCFWRAESLRSVVEVQNAFREACRAAMRNLLAAGHPITEVTTATFTGWVDEGPGDWTTRKRVLLIEVVRELERRKLSQEKNQEAKEAAA